MMRVFAVVFAVLFFGASVVRADESAWFGLELSATLPDGTVLPMVWAAADSSYRQPGYEVGSWVEVGGVQWLAVFRRYSTGEDPATYVFQAQTVFGDVYSQAFSGPLVLTSLSQLSAVGGMSHLGEVFETLSPPLLSLPGSGGGTGGDDGGGGVDGEGHAVAPSVARALRTVTDQVFPASLTVLSVLGVLAAIFWVARQMGDKPAPAAVRNKLVEVPGMSAIERERAEQRRTGPVLEYKGRTYGVGDGDIACNDDVPMAVWEDFRRSAQVELAWQQKRESGPVLEYRGKKYGLWDGTAAINDDVPSGVWEEFYKRGSKSKAGVVFKPKPRSRKRGGRPPGKKGGKAKRR
jgi:hypothetical protein